jgi:uncharacterized protein YndB with AHSA1/START domain
MMRKPETVYVTYIAATPEKVWEALTSAKFTKQFFFGRSIEVDLKVGGAFVLRMEDGRVDTQGKVLACDPPRLLTVTWKVEFLEEFRHLPAAIVTFKIDPFGNSVRLTLIQQVDESIDERMLEGGRTGWPIIFSGLKTLLETGRPLQVPSPEPPPSQGAR